MAGVTVRAARASDAAQVGRMTRAVYVDGGFADPATSPEYVADLADGAARIAQATVFVAEAGGRLIGTVTAAEVGNPWSHIAQPGELEVRMLAVEPAGRRRGAAGALMAQCEALARDRGLAAVVLSTDPAMHSAHRLYEGRGYRRTPQRDWSYDGHPLLTYRWQPGG